MKTFALAILAVVSVCNTDAQSIEKIKVPEVKENYKIDSLIGYGIGLLIPNESCMLIKLHQHGKSYSCFVSCIKINLSMIDLGMERSDKDSLILMHRNNLRYFYYKGALVFVSGANDPFNFFKYKKKSKVFTFTYSTEKDIDSYSKRTYYVDLFRYENGQFVTWMTHPIDN